MGRSERIITYWLCPAEPAHSQLSAIIGDLAARFNAPVFEPHVTLYVTSADGVGAATVVEKVVKTRAPYRLTVRGIDYSDEFTKTLFVQFAPDRDVAGLSDELRRASASASDYKLNPHLSLIYRELDRDTKRGLATSLRLPFTEVVFSSVKAVLSPGTIRSREDVEAWRVVAERRLTG